MAEESAKWEELKRQRLEALNAEGKLNQTTEQRLSKLREFIGLGREELELRGLTKKRIEEILSLEAELTREQRKKLQDERTVAAVRSLGIESASESERIAASFAARNQSSRLWGMAEYRKRLEEEIAIEGKGSAAQIAKIEELDKLKRRFSENAVLGASIEGRAYQNAVKSGSPKGATRATGDLGLVGTVSRAAGLSKLAEAEKEAADHGVRMGFGQELASVGVSKLLDVLGPGVAGITAASAAFAGAGTVAAMFIAGLDKTREIAAPTMLSMSQVTGKMAMTRMAFQDDATSITNSFRKAFDARGINAFGVGVSYAESIVKDQLLPSAQKAAGGMRFLFGTTKGQIADFTAGLTEVGGAGIMAGMDLDTASKMGVDMARVFGLSTKNGRDVSATFSSMSKSATAAGLHVEELVGSMMDMDQAGQGFGNQSKMYEVAAKSLIKMGLAGDLANQKLVLGLTKTFMEMPLGRELGLTMAANKGMGFGGAVSKFTEATSKKGGGGMVGLALEDVAGIMKRQGLDKKLAGGGQGRAIAAMAIGGIFGSDLLTKKLAGGDQKSENLRRALLSLGTGKVSDTDKKLLRNLESQIKAESNPALVAATYLGFKKDTLSQIMGWLKSMAENIEIMAASFRPTAGELKAPQGATPTADMRQMAKMT